MATDSAVNILFGSSAAGADGQGSSKGEHSRERSVSQCFLPNPFEFATDHRDGETFNDSLLVLKRRAGVLPERAACAALHS